MEQAMLVHFGTIHGLAFMFDGDEKRQVGQKVG